MKKKSLFILLILVNFGGWCQPQRVSLSHYILDDFVKGTVLMVGGVKNQAVMNYNSLTEEMIFEEKGKRLAITQLERIDTIYLDGRKFVPLQNKLVEVIYASKLILYAQHRCNVKEPGKPAAYGGTSQTSSTTSYSSIMSGGQSYALKLPEGYETQPYLEYWLKKDGSVSKFVNMRQLSKLFEPKSADFKAYVKEHKVSFDKEESLIGLLKFLEQ